MNTFSLFQLFQTKIYLGISGNYHTPLNLISKFIMIHKFYDSKTFIFWYEQLYYLRFSMICRIIKKILMKFFIIDLILVETNVNTILGFVNLIQGSKTVTIMLSRGTKFHIIDALYSIQFNIHLFSFKDLKQISY